jgi:hypothetical protein
MYKKVCQNCQHECHCDNNVCPQPVGVGMSDKWETCGCGVCRCSPKDLGEDGR